jgi:hypothetical protein
MRGDNLLATSEAIRAARCSRMPELIHKLNELRLPLRRN